jgi:hypothetical protein
MAKRKAKDPLGDMVTGLKRVAALLGDDDVAADWLYLSLRVDVARQFCEQSAEPYTQNAAKVAGASRQPTPDAFRAASASATEALSSLTAKDRKGALRHVNAIIHAFLRLG